MSETAAAVIGQEGGAPEGGPPGLHDLPDLMNVEEIAAALRVNKKTVYEACKNGDLPFVRIGKLLRFHRDAVVEWLRGNGGVSRSPRRKR